MRRTLVVVGGVLNVLFFVLHVFMGYSLHGAPRLDAPVRALLETFNLVTAVTVGFFAFVSLVYAGEALRTRIGRSVLVLIALFYLCRSVAEFAFMPAVTPTILIACLIVVALYAAALLIRDPRAAATA